MFTEFSIPKTSMTVRIALKALWILRSNPSYDVKRGDYSGDNLVLIRTVKGKGILVVEGKEPYVLSEGTLLIIELSKINRYYCTGETWDFWWFEFTSCQSPSFKLYELIKTEILSEEREQVYNCLNLLREDEEEAKYLASSIFSVLMFRWIRNTNIKRLGYTSPFHFTREFKKYKKKAPTEFRNSLSRKTSRY